MPKFRVTATRTEEYELYSVEADTEGQAIDKVSKALSEVFGNLDLLVLHKADVFTDYSYSVAEFRKYGVEEVTQ